MTQQLNQNETKVLSAAVGSSMDGTRDQIKITDFRSAYQRNGIGGEGSTVAFFVAEFDGHEPQPMMAVMWGDDTEDELPTEAMVLSLNDIGPIAMRFLTGDVPQEVSDFPRETEDDRRKWAPLGAFRSTDHFLPVLRPLVKADQDARWNRT